MSSLLNTRISLLLVTVWAGSLAAAWYAGKSHSAAGQDNPRTEAGAGSRRPSAGTMDSSTVPAAPPAATGKRNALDSLLESVPRSVEDEQRFREGIAAALQRPVPASERLAMVAKMLAAMNAQNARLVREGFGLSWDAGCHFQSEHDQMWMRYGEIMGEAGAAEFAKTEGPFYPVYGKMLEAWAMTDPAALRQWIGTLGEGPKRLDILRSAMRGLAAVDPAGALTAALAMPGSERRAALMAAESGAGNLSGTPGANRFRDALAALPPGQFDQVFATVASQDPVVAVTWAEAFSKLHPQSSQMAYNAIADSWGRRDVGELSQWLASIKDHPGSDSMTLRMVRMIAKDDPEAATAWAAKIKDKSMRTEALKLLR